MKASAKRTTTLLSCLQPFSVKGATTLLSCLQRSDSLSAAPCHDKSVVAPFLSAQACFQQPLPHPSSTPKPPSSAPKVQPYDSPGQRPGFPRHRIASPERATQISTPSPTPRTPLQGSDTRFLSNLGRCPRLTYSTPLGSSERSQP